MKNFFPILFLLLPFQSASQERDQHAASELSRHLHFLCSPELKGRRAGTPEADVAARYIASEFVRLGLEPIGESGEGGRDFAQPFEIPGKAEPGINSHLEWVANGHPAALTVEALPFSSASSEEPGSLFNVKGETLQVSRESFQKGSLPAELKGKIAVIAAPASTENNPHQLGNFAIAKKAKEAGAVGLLFLRKPESTTGKSEPSADAGIPAAWVEEGREIGNPVELFIDLKRPKKKTRNVLGWLPGKEGAKETIVIGAHYDHLGQGGEESLSPGNADIHFGADDNASGSAALIEITEMLAPEKGKLARNILFAAFGAEEEGLLGSAEFVKNSPVPLDQIVCMLNLDMVGRLKEGKLELGGVGTSPKLREIIEKANATVNLKLKLSEGALGFGGSDHLSFYQKNIPVLFFFTGLHSDYHKPSDTPEKINYEGIQQISELTAGIAKDLATSGEKLPFTKPKEPERKEGQGGPRAYLGSIPEYGDYSDGVHISGTSPNSPAEKAGLKAGDVITKIGKVEIKSIYDLTYALEQYKAGETVEVEFTRSGEKKKLSLTLGSR